MTGSGIAQSPTRGKYGSHELWYALSALLILIGYCLLSYSRGEESYVLVHDYLDCFFPVQQLAERGLLWGGLDTQASWIFNGLPRNCLPSELKIATQIEAHLAPFTALVVKEVLVRLVALLGMLLLLRRHLLPHANNLVIYGSSVAFSLLPFYPVAFLSVAGLPLVLAALLVVRGGRASLWDWIILVVYPFASVLVLTGVFILLSLGAWILWDIIRKRRICCPLIGCALILGSLYVLSEYRVLYQNLLNHDYVSHRTEFRKEGLGTKAALVLGAKNFLIGDYQATTLQFPFILLSVGLAFFLSLLQGMKSEGASPPCWLGRMSNREETRIPSTSWSLLCVLVLVAVGSVLNALYFWKPVVALLSHSGMGILNQLNLGRFFWLQPPLWGIALALALQRVHESRPIGRFLVGILLLCQLAFLFTRSNTEHERHATGLTYRQFFSEELFGEIRDAIGRPQSDYRVVSLGLFPSIALSNGFQVLDGYIEDYPLEYKHQFRKVIEREIEKNPAHRRTFDTWGSRCFLLSGELECNHLYTRADFIRSVQNLEIDVESLRALGGEYILSAVEIRNAADLGLIEENVFERDDSPWRIHLYRTR